MGFLIITLIANFLENLSVKNIDNRLRFDEVTRKSLVSPFFVEVGVQEAQLLQRDRASPLCQLRFCQRLSKCTKNST